MFDMKACYLLLVLPLLASCVDSNQLQIVISESASITEKMTADDLKDDLEKVTNLQVSIVDEGSTSRRNKQIIIGTSSSNLLLQKILSENQIELTPNKPGSRGGLWHKLDNQTIILAGSDGQGMQYAIYDYSKEVLGIDPLIYWTGHAVNEIEENVLFSFENKRIAPPKVPLLVYFENDVDELANLKEPLLQYDWESYTEMIDALVRMRYNGIQFFDMLGRPEFFLREEYKKISPNYQLDIDYLDSMVNYAQDRGMKIQIDMSLGYQIKPMDSQYADCWKENKDKWIKTWRYYLTETPLKKADIFSLRPRNQVWDWEYKSTCGEDKASVFNEVYFSLDSILNVYKPEATKVVICYHDGMELFNEDFNPPKDWIVAWSDDGYSRFKYWPDSTKGYQFGTYMHAGFWKNHTVSDPYPHRIDSIMNKMFERYNATSYCQVNGQQFRQFLVNLEAFSEVCRDPKTYSGDIFYKRWAKRYFPNALTSEALNIMKLWHEYSSKKSGYVQNLWEIKEAIAYLSQTPIEMPGKPPEAYSAAKVEGDMDEAKTRLSLFKELAFKTEQLLPKLDTSSYFFYDQVYLPINLYADLLQFEGTLHEIYQLKRGYEKSSNPDIKKRAMVNLEKARKQLDVVYKRSLDGDKNPRWKGWYAPAKRRPNNGFPTKEMLDQIEIAINEKW